MSMEQVKSFIKKMKSDEAFSERIMSIEDPDERFKAIAEAGFDFTKDELTETGKEIEEADLKHVTGGGEGCGGKMVCMNFACLITTAYKPKS